MCKYLNNRLHNFIKGARGGAVGWGTALQTASLRVLFPMVSMEFFIDNPFDRIMALGLTASNRN
jgi:hypothetical protein